VFSPVIHNFDNSASGISDGVIPDQPTVLDIFQFFSPQKLCNTAAETNKYYVFVTQKMPASPCSRVQKWRDTMPKELYVFIAKKMLMVRVKKLTILGYWSADPQISTPPNFQISCQETRYLLLLRLLHFGDNNNQPEGDQLYKIKPIIDHLKKQFNEVFTPFENLCIDESLTLFKGQLSFIQ
jgi:hypothetical protein